MRPYHVASRVGLNPGGHAVVPCPGARCHGNYQIAQMDWYGGDNRKWRVPRAKVRSDIYDAVSVLGISPCGWSPGETVPRWCRGGFAPPRLMLCRRSYHDRAPGGRTCLRPVLAGACARRSCCRATRHASRSPMQCARCRRNRVGRPVLLHRDASRLCRSCTDCDPAVNPNRHPPERTVPPLPCS